MTNPFFRPPPSFSAPIFVRHPQPPSLHLPSYHTPLPTTAHETPPQTPFLFATIPTVQIRQLQRSQGDTRHPNDTSDRLGRRWHADGARI